MKNTSLKNSISKGFSLVEMLVVIAVIGVIAAIAIPNIGSINQSAKDARNQRNAQSIVSMYQSGSAAGVAWDGGSSVTAKVNAVIAGAEPSDGAFAGKIFKVPYISNTDRDEACRYIGIDENDDLYYNKSGVAAVVPAGP
jgi:prepilin-type N-terminal cleavage/methylation domain-containing protein